MVEILREILANGKVSLTLKGFTAEGGLGIAVVLIIALVLLFRFSP